MNAEVIDYVKFGVLSPEEVRKMSVAKLTVPDTYNEDGYPIDGGLLDQRLGVIDPGLLCKTCGARAKVCPGHFGHIELVRPVIHSEFSKIINILLQSTCQKCGRILLTPEEIEKARATIRKEVGWEEGEEQSNEADRNLLIKKVKGTKKCPYCGAPQEHIKFEGPTHFYLGQYKLKPDEIKDMLARISDDDLKLLGIDPKTSRPEWLVISSLLVPPVNVRPSITLESGERSEDDLTHKLVDIMRINQRLEQNINAGAPQIIIDDLWELLQYHVTTYFNNETAGIPPARHRSGRALKTLAQRLKGKEGRFRYNLSGKRVNYSARTVISPDPYIAIDEIGVPLEIAKRITIPFYVTEWNLEEAKQLLARNEYPMVTGTIERGGKRKRITDATRDEALKSIAPGTILEKQIVDGDIILFNRQPSLHRISIMAHKVKVLPGKTFRINPCTTTPYGADFDGDEMNVHMPQTLEAEAEAKYIMAAQDQVFSPRDGNAIITPYEDGVLGIYVLTLESTSISKDDATYLLGLSGIYELPKANKDGSYSGRDIFSMLLPKDLDFEQNTKFGMLRIKNGRIIEGSITQDVVGRGSKLLLKISKDYGNDALNKFITNSTKMSYAYTTLYGLTIGIKDYIISKNLEEFAGKKITEALSTVETLTKQYKEKKLEPLLGYTAKQSLEKLIIVELDKARDALTAEASKVMSNENNPVLMARAGSKGSMLNFTQMIMMLGQQATLTGSRVTRGYYSHRIVPIVRPKDSNPVAKGFVRSNYFKGLTPLDLYTHGIASRGSIIYKGLLTGRSGYLQRRLINALQDYYVGEDYSVKDTHGNIIESVYGSDGIDPVFIEMSRLEAAEKSSGRYNISPGEPVGVVAAQSLGEPGTQMILRTFHMAGIASAASIGTSGLPRLMELVDAKKKPDLTFTYVYLKGKASKNFDEAYDIARKINEVKVSGVLKKSIEHFSKGIITLMLDPQRLEVNNLTPKRVAEKIEKLMKVDVDIDGNKLIINAHTKDLKNIRDLRVHISNLTINGIEGAGTAVVRQDEKSGEFYIISSGNNLKGMATIEEVDMTRIYTNDVFEMYRMFGIEVAREVLAKEIIKVLDEQRIRVSDRHIYLLADAMTARGSIKSIGRHGLTGEKNSVFARAAYEETVKHLISAAAFGEVDQMLGVTENVLIGKQILLGTGSVQLEIKKEDLAKIKPKK